MTNLPFSPVERAKLYADRKKMAIHKQPLGGGYDGIVLATTGQTAIKAFNSLQLYRQEKAVYIHLLEKKIFSVSGFKVPKLIGYDDPTYVIEMTIVSPPFVVDFAGASLSRPMPFPDDVMDEWRKQKKEEFAEDWPKVNRLKYAFEQRGIFLNDVHPRNVVCR